MLFPPPEEPASIGFTAARTRRAPPSASVPSSRFFGVGETPSSFLPHLNSSVSILHHHQHDGRLNSHPQHSHSFWPSRFRNHNNNNNQNNLHSNTTTDAATLRHHSFLDEPDSYSDSHSIPLLLVTRFLILFVAIGKSLLAKISLSFFSTNPTTLFFHRAHDLWLENFQPLLYPSYPFSHSSYLNSSLYRLISERQSSYSFS